MKIAFLSNKLTLRGTEVSLFDYADYNESILNNSSIIITRDYNDISGEKDVSKEAYDKFTNRFNVFYYKDIEDVEIIIQNNNIDVVFIEKAGGKADTLNFKSCKTIIHAVFTLNEPHGNVFTSLSEWLNIKHNTNYPVIPYMVRIHDTTDNLRKELNIPESATVFGTYSGADCFNIDYIIECIKDIINEKKEDIYFIFLNIDPFMINSEHIRFLPGTSDMKYKRMFINTCDAMIYGRKGGETFGLSCGEFSLADKPVIGTAEEHSASHIHILEDKMIKHKNYDELYKILTKWNEYKINVSDNGYKKYTPQYCMNKFNDVLNILFPFKETLKIYLNGFWTGFDNQTDPINSKFFIDLFEKVFEKNIILGTKENSDILFESHFSDSQLNFKKWKYTIFFSGETHEIKNKNEYTFILSGERNKDNIINVPLFIPYIYNNEYYNKLQNIKIDRLNKCNIPCATVISNSSSQQRNFIVQSFMNKLPIASFGKWMNNVGFDIPHHYTTKEFKDFISQFSFYLALENNVNETYITEKIFHAFFSDSIPIYFGSPYIKDYINEERIIILNEINEEEIQKSVYKIEYLLNNPNEYRKILEKPVFNSEMRYFNDIYKDIKSLLNKPDELKYINKIFCICNKEYESERFNRLDKLFKSLHWDTQVEYNCKTYKSTIDDDQYKKYVKTDDIFYLRNSLLKKGELSLTLNFLEIFKTIKKNYSSGIFMTLESDILINGDINNISKIIETLNNFDKSWDCVHIGYDKPNILNEYDYYKNDIGIRRKFNPRCTDSFIWTYNGILKILNYLENKLQYSFSIPFDYIFNNLLKDKDFHFYWSNPTIFIQGSNAGLEKSTIQNDLN